MVEIINQTAKHITVRMSLPAFKKSGILKDAKYDFPTADETKLFNKYKKVDIKKLSKFSKLING